MRRVQYFVACSLDGFIATEKDDFSWLFTDADYGYEEFYESIDTTLTGRKTFDIIKGFEEFPYSGKKNYVFSRNQHSEPHPEIKYIHEDIIPFVQELKNSQGKNIWLIGGGEIAAILENAGLIDDYIISIHPIILGKGKPLFAKADQLRHLKLNECISYPSGLVQVRYSKVNLP